MALFVQCRNEQDIQAELNKKNISISRSEIGYLGNRFVVYLAQAHQEAQPEIKRLLRDRGGYILHLDGTCEGSSVSLMTGLDEISGIVLWNTKIPSESRDHIVPFLRRIEQDYGTPLALVHDMGSGILAAIEEVFPHVLDFICHFHFLRDVGKDLLQHDNNMIRNALKRHRIRKMLREQARALKKFIDEDSVLTRALRVYQGSVENNSVEILSSTVCAYVLILWILDGNAELNGYGFPFDRADLVFYQRLDESYVTIRNLRDKGAGGQALTKLYRVIERVMHDNHLSRLIRKMKEKVEIFEQLREAMRIAMPDGKQGLNDPGIDIDLESIKERVTVFRYSKELQQAASRDMFYKGMVKQIDKYREKLFADPIKAKTPSGCIIIQPQRTNNSSERFFREIKKDYRKRIGAHSLTKPLQTMIANTPLIKNLRNQKYLDIILNGDEDLAERFAEIDIQLVRQELKEQQQKPEKIPARLKKMLRTSDFVAHLVALSSKK